MSRRDGKTTKKNHGVTFKVKVELEAIKDEQTLVELAERFDIYPYLLCGLDTTETNGMDEAANQLKTTLC